MNIFHLIPYPQSIEKTPGSFQGSCFYKATSTDILLNTIEEELASCYHTNKTDSSIGNDSENGTCIKLDLIIDSGYKAQASKLQVKENQITITARDSAGLLYGFMTLKQLIAQFGCQIPCLIIEDWPTVLHRGVQVSYAQVNVEYRQEWIKRFIRQMADIKINYLYLYFEWNFAFPSLPPANSKNQLNPQNANEIISYARKYNISVIPQLNIMGHTQDFLAAQIFDDLKEYNQEQGSLVSEAGTSLCVSNPKTLKIIENIISDVVEIFDSEIIHVGGDEVELIGECPLCCDEKKASGRMGVYLRYFIFVRDLLRAKGRKMGIWGDQIMNFSPDNRYWCKKNIESEYLEYNIAQLTDLKSGTVVYDWWYDGGSEKSIEFFANSGFEFICATSTHGCMTSTLNFGQQMNQHALFRDSIKYNAHGGVITEWINYLGYHAEQMSFNFASGASMLWTGCDEHFIKGVCRNAFEKAYAFVRFGDKTDALLNYIHFSGDSNGEILSLFPPEQKGWALRKRLFYTNNPLDFFLWQAKNLGNGKDLEYVKQADLLAGLWENVERNVQNDGYLIFLKLGTLMHSHLSKRFMVCKEFYELYNKAAIMQYSDKDLFVSHLSECTRCLGSILNDFDDLIDYTKQLSLKLGVENASTFRLEDTRLNFERLIDFIESLKDGHRPLPSLLNISTMLFNKPLNEYWVGRNVDWYNESKKFRNYDLDNKANCCRVEY